MGIVFRRIDETATEPDGKPEHWIPLPPHCGGLAILQSGRHLRRVAEHLRHDIGDFVVAQHVPFGIAAHHRRADGKHHAANPRLADWKRAHRARLDVRIDRAVRQVAAAEDPLGRRYGQDFGVPGDVAILYDAVDRFGHDLAVPADHAGEWQLALPDGGRG